jgi:hypothetical protein
MLIFIKLKNLQDDAAIWNLKFVHNIKNTNNENKHFSSNNSFGLSFENTTVRSANESTTVNNNIINNDNNINNFENKSFLNPTGFFFLSYTYYLFFPSVKTQIK